MSQKCMQEKYLLFFIKIKKGTFVYTLCCHNKTNYTTNHGPKSFTCLPNHNIYNERLLKVLSTNWVFELGSMGMNGPSPPYTPTDGQILNGEGGWGKKSVYIL